MPLHERRLLVGDPLGGGEGPPRTERQLVVPPVAEHHRPEQVGHRCPVWGVRVVGECDEERHHVRARPYRVPWW